MSEAIQVNRLSKRYRLGARQERYGTLRDTIAGAALGPLRAVRSIVKGQKSTGSDDIIWALQDVSFEVRTGEVVGVIGRNGAGKSTLLKVLSRITEPTSGYADIHGRVASLLEVGTGFHPELTGRENLLLNGAILGMPRRHIEHKFDEIVAFAEVEKFIDTPVKRYSSGMYLRLAFAVAAHLEPEILVVDEVLAVGDAAFQKKCIGKMSDISQEGRTILFVSHNMAAVKALCTRAILMKAGTVAEDGDVNRVVEAYSAIDSEIASDGIIPDDAPRRYKKDDARFRSLRLLKNSGEETRQLYLGQPFRVSLTIEAFEDIREAVVEVVIEASDGAQVTCSRTLDDGGAPFALTKGVHEITLDLHVTLIPRQYSLTLVSYHFDSRIIEWIDRVFDFTVLNMAENSDDTYRFANDIKGYVRPEGRWSLPASLNN